MRFTSNGYPEGYIAVVEYDSWRSIPEDLPIVHAEIDARIAELQAATGRTQVDLMGHSRGTTVSHAYLAFPERAANVGRYVNIDGRERRASGRRAHAGPLGGGVDRPVQGEIVGATNVTIPNQEHIEVATSEEAFFEMYHFLRGHAPLTTRSCPSSGPDLRAGGHVPRQRRTRRRDAGDLVGRRRHRREDWQRPEATFAIGPDGDSGPSWPGTARITSWR